MLKLGMIKSGIQLLTTTGVGFITSEAIAKVVEPKNLTGLRKISVKVGSFVLGAMVADKASEYVEHVWDETIDGFKDLVKPKEEVNTTEETEAI